MGAADFTGRVALITGGSGGIGLATAHAFAERGADVIITGRDRERGAAAVEGLSRHGRTTRFVSGDVGDARHVAAVYADIDATFGRLDIVFNNAGVAAVGPIDMVDEAAWDACIDTNLKGTFLVSREAIPRLRAGGGGVIINNASNAGLLARARDPVYCASKAGLIMLTRAMALGHAADRIRVNAVCPGPVDAPGMEASLARAADPEAERRAVIAASPLAAAHARMIQAEEIASAVLYLCSDEAAMITGAVLSIDGGKSAGIAR